MPNDLTIEEQAMYIYCKLCKDLSYDEGYFFRELLESGRYEHTFSKEHLESIIPGSKVTCWDFARIASKMINEIDGNIESVIISENINHDHYLVGFYTDKVSVILEAVNGRTGGTNDLMKAKNGIEFEGIEIISDREGIIKKAVEKVYPLIFSKSQISIKEYLQELNDLSREKIPDDFETKLQAFTQMMKKNNIFGNEAIQTFNTFQHVGFFGGKIDIAYLGKPQIKDDKKNYIRLVLIRTKNDSQSLYSDTSLFLLDSDTLEVLTCTSQEIIDKLNSGEFIYENKKHQLPGINMEEKL